MRSVPAMLAGGHTPQLYWNPGRWWFVGQRVLSGVLETAPLPGKWAQYPDSGRASSLPISTPLIASLLQPSSSAAPRPSRPNVAGVQSRLSSRASLQILQTSFVASHRRGAQRAGAPIGRPSLPLTPYQTD
ncbi:hypothetical protein TgHK011_005557 [Trichoderma gracile]|nr:hypothetical protein TgHK011_005557 [Trichoderma gracile]